MVPTLTLCLCMLHRNTSRRVFGRYLASCRRIACPPMSCSTPSCRCVYHGAARAVSRWQEMGQILAPLHCSAQCWQRDSGVSFHFTRPKTEAGHELVSDRSYIWTRQWNSYRWSASPCFYWIQPGFIQLHLHSTPMSIFGLAQRQEWQDGNDQGRHTELHNGFSASHQKDTSDSDPPHLPKASCSGE